MHDQVTNKITLTLPSVSLVQHFQIQFMHQQCGYFECALLYCSAEWFDAQCSYYWLCVFTYLSLLRWIVAKTGLVVVLWLQVALWAHWNMRWIVVVLPVWIRVRQAIFLQASNAHRNSIVMNKWAASFGSAQILISLLAPCYILTNSMLK